MDNLIENITISTFVCPHLFWIIERDSQERSKCLADLEKELKKLTENENNNSEFDSVEVGQVCFYVK